MQFLHFNFNPHYFLNSSILKYTPLRMTNFTTRTIAILIFSRGLVEPSFFLLSHSPHCRTQTTRHKLFLHFELQWWGLGWWYNGAEISSIVHWCRHYHLRNHFRYHPSSTRAAFYQWRRRVRVIIDIYPFHHRWSTCLPPRWEYYGTGYFIPHLYVAPPRNGGCHRHRYGNGK